MMSGSNRLIRRKLMVTVIQAVSLAILLLGPAIVRAQTAEQERDPFFSSGPRAGTATPAAPDAAWGRDPFSRPFTGGVQQQKATGTSRRDKNLTGIIYSSKVRLAIIQGDIHREGSMVGNQKLVDIRQRSIVLMNSSGGTEEVFLEDFSIRK